MLLPRVLFQTKGRRKESAKRLLLVDFSSQALFQVRGPHLLPSPGRSSDCLTERWKEGMEPSPLLQESEPFLVKSEIGLQHANLPGEGLNGVVLTIV